MDKSIYKTYNNVIFLFFDLINKKGIDGIDYKNFRVIINKNFNVVIDDEEHYYPLLLKADDVYDLKRLYETLNYIPLIKMKLLTPKSVSLSFNNSKQPYSIKMIKNEDIAKTLINEFYKPVLVDDVHEDKINEILERYGIDKLDERITPKYRELHDSSVNQNTIYSVGYYTHEYDIAIIKNGHVIRYFDLI